MSRGGSPRPAGKACHFKCNYDVNGMCRGDASKPCAFEEDITSSLPYACATVESSLARLRKKADAIEKARSGATFGGNPLDQYNVRCQVSPVAAGGAATGSPRAATPGSSGYYGYHGGSPRYARHADGTSPGFRGFGGHDRSSQGHHGRRYGSDSYRGTAGNQSPVSRGYPSYASHYNMPGTSMPLRRLASRGRSYGQGHRGAGSPGWW
jgi:hypothetical protein